MEGSGDGRRDAGGRRPAGWLHGAAVLALFTGLAVAVRPVLSPFVLYALLLYLAWPLLDTSVFARLVAAASVLLGLWVLEVTGFLLAPFVLALILAYVLDPVVDALQRWMPRPAAIASLALPILGVAAVFVFVLVPAVGRQASELVADVPTYLATVEEWLSGLRSRLIALDIRGLDDRTLPDLAEIDAQAVAEYLRERQAEIAERGIDAVLGIGRGIRAVVSAAAYLVMLPLLTYYLLRDWDRLAERAAKLVPHHRRQDVLDLAAEYDGLLHRYLRGQVLLAICVGTMIGVGFWIVGFPYALLLGLVAGVFNVVPYLGLVLSIAVALVIALFSGAPLVALLKIAGVYGVEQVVENVIAPKIVGESVGLHPVWVLLAIALFGFFFGFVGLLIAVPVAVLARLAVERAVARYRSSAWYLKGSPSGPD